MCLTCLSADVPISCLVDLHLFLNASQRRPNHAFQSAQRALHWLQKTSPQGTNWTSVSFMPYFLWLDIRNSVLEEINFHAGNVHQLTLTGVNSFIINTSYLCSPVPLSPLMYRVVIYLLACCAQHSSWPWSVQSLLLHLNCMDEWMNEQVTEWWHYILLVLNTLNFPHGVLSP